jgi:hypothetical protein
MCLSFCSDETAVLALLWRLMDGWLTGMPWNLGGICSFDTPSIIFLPIFFEIISLNTRPEVKIPWRFSRICIHWPEFLWRHLITRINPALIILGVVSFLNASFEAATV